MSNKMKSVGYLLGVILLSMIIASSYTVIATGLSVRAITSHGSQHYDLVEVNIHAIGKTVQPSRIIVTVLNGSREVEVPYIPKPSGEFTVKQLVDILYGNRSIYNLTYPEYQKLLDMIQKHKIDHDLIKTIIGETRFHSENINSSSILVYLPGNLYPSSTEKIKSWDPYALRSNLTHRAVYQYRDKIIYVYYNMGSSKHVEREIHVPQTLSNTITSFKILDNRGKSIGNGIVDLRPNVLYGSNHDRAELVRIETLEKSTRNTSDSYDALWYERPWESQNRGRGEIRLGDLRNRKLTGGYLYYISGKFTVKHNTTRYEVWIWLSSDESVSGSLYIILNGDTAGSWSYNMQPGTLYGFGVVVHTTPEEPGNYLSPQEIDVGAYIMVDNKDAKINVIAQALAKAYIHRTYTSRDGVYLASTRLKGIGDLQESGEPQNPLDERYEMLYRGEADFEFLAPQAIIPSSYYPSIYLWIVSSPSQKYDRLVKIYLNG